MESIKDADQQEGSWVSTSAHAPLGIPKADGYLNQLPS